MRTRYAVHCFHSVLALLLLGPTLAAAEPSTAAPSSTASGAWEGYANSFVMGVFPAAPITKLTFHLQRDDLYGPIDPTCRFFLPDEPPSDSYDSGELTLQFWFPDALLTRSQAIAVCSSFTHDYDGALLPQSFYLSKLEARDENDDVVPVSLCVTDWNSDQSIEAPPVDGCREACGDADCSGGPITTSDALHVLRRSVALADWPLRRCDTDADGAVAADDALRVLRASVGMNPNLLCSSSDSIYCLPDESW